jgi:hypothetical protein
MSAAVAHLLEEVLLLPIDSQTELVEAILEHSEPSRDFLDHQIGIVTQRMQRVRDGTSFLVAAEDAHSRVLKSLKARE